MNTTCVLPFVLVVFVLNFVKVNGIKCFQCNSVEHPGCEDLTTEDLNSPYLKECVENHSNSTPFCRKTKYIILDKEGFLRISRECGWILHRDNTTRCYDVDTDFKYEISCQCFQDACNKSITTPPPFYLIITLIICIIMNRCH